MRIRDWVGLGLVVLGGCGPQPAASTETPTESGAAAQEPAQAESAASVAELAGIRERST